MKISCIGLDSKFKDPQTNYKRAKEKIEEAMVQNPDVIVLPELFPTGFFPKNVKEFADRDGLQTKEIFSTLAKKHNINIVAGSVATQKEDKIFNTSYVFNRSGEVISEYDKTHLFTFMGEDQYFSFGQNLSTFILDGYKCGIIICYDLRFVELVRTLALQDIKMLFIVTAWPKERLHHLETLTIARAIENHIFTILCNSTSNLENVKFGGNSMIIDPLGATLVKANENEHIITAKVDPKLVDKIKNKIDIYKDRREELYNIKEEK